ncbi:MAG TPA: hypothetical protein VEW95_11925 [Candidatus Limnocylindrales bacterium]|nr:hypothetical protein [Candidatus Limnocylindrales bacterium]
MLRRVVALAGLSLLLSASPTLAARDPLHLSATLQCSRTQLIARFVASDRTGLISAGWTVSGPGWGTGTSRWMGGQARHYGGTVTWPRDLAIPPGRYRLIGSADGRTITRTVDCPEAARAG